MGGFWDSRGSLLARGCRESSNDVGTFPECARVSRQKEVEVPVLGRPHPGAREGQHRSERGDPEVPGVVTIRPVYLLHVCSSPIGNCLLTSRY